MQRKAILYIAIMTNHAEDICRILHMAKVFPCLFSMGTKRITIITHEIMTRLFTSLIH